LAIGNHVDHQIVAAAGLALLEADAAPRHDLTFYEDTPYVCIPHLLRQRFEQAGIAPAPGAPPAIATCAREAYTALMSSRQLASHAGPVTRRLLLAYLVVRFARARAGARRRRRYALRAELTDIGDQFDTKVAAVACYESQVTAIYGDDGTMRRELAACSATACPGGACERYWLPAEPFGSRAAQGTTFR
jgi:LmbE family N-acetylglucosaminyl deacetylase